MPKKGKGKGAASLIPILSERAPHIAAAIQTLRERALVNPKLDDIVAAKACDDVAAFAAVADVNRQDMADAGVIAPLVELVSNGTPTYKAKATYAIRALAYNNPWGGAYRNTSVIAAAGGVPPLVALLREAAHAAVHEDATGALCNIADNTATRTAIAQAGGIASLIALVASERVELAVLAAYTLGKVAFSHEQNQSAIVKLDGKRELTLLAGRLAANGSSEQREMVDYALRNLLPRPPPAEPPAAAAPPKAAKGKKK